MITVNGKKVQISRSLTVTEYLEENHYQQNRIAVEINGKILPKSAYASVTLKEGDVLKIVSFVGGG